MEHELEEKSLCVLQDIRVIKETDAEQIISQLEIALAIYLVKN